MRRVLVTAFGPFAEVSSNPSEEIVRALRCEDVETLVLPVAWDALGALERKISSRDWIGILLLGVDRGRRRFALERVAINYCDPESRDVRGRPPPGTRVVAGAPNAYFSTLPLERFADELRARDLPMEYSLSAGAYLCNAAFFAARRLTNGHPTPCGLVHVPPTPALAGDGGGVPIERQVEAVEAFVGILTEEK